MNTFNLQLLDFPGRYDGKDLPHGPRAYISLKHFSKVGDVPILSTDCIDIDEFHSNVNRLIKELRAIEKEAEAFFAEDEKRRQEYRK